MSPKRVGGLHLAVAAGCFVFGSASVAWAEPLQINVLEDAYGATIQVRATDDEIPAPRKVRTADDGAIFFFPQQDAEVKRLHTTGDHRLEYVQIGRSRSRAALRIKQSDASSGALANFMSHEKVPGGFDIRIEDRPARRTRAKTMLATATRDDSLAELDRKLADEVVAAPIVAAAPVAAPPEVDPPFRDASLAPTIAPDPLPAAPSEVTPEDELFPAANGAADPLAANAAAPGPGDARSPWPYVVLLGMAAFIGAGWWLRKHKRLEPEHGMEIVSRLSLAPRQQIVWLRAGGRQFLVGATDRGIAMLTELGTPATSAALGTSTPAPSAAVGEGEAKVAAFKARLQRALGDELRDTGRPATEPFGATSPDAALPEHLRRLSEDAFWPSREDAA